jgi:hypothetical protein
MRTAFTSALGVLLLSNLSAEPEIKGAPAELGNFLANVPRTVTITGEAELKVQADRAMISLKVNTENKSLQEALRSNQDVRNKVVKTLTDHGLAAEQIQASKFSSTPRYGLFGDKAKSYRVENVMKIAAHDEKQFQAAAQLVDALIELQYQGIQFEHSEKQALKDKALILAIENALARKQIFEERLGVTLIPKAFSNDAGVAQAQAPAMLKQESGSGFAKSLKGPTPIPGAVARGLEVEESMSPFGELIFVAHVAIDYSVEKK